MSVNDMKILAPISQAHDSNLKTKITRVHFIEMSKEMPSRNLVPILLIKKKKKKNVSLSWVLS